MMRIKIKIILIVLLICAIFVQARSGCSGGAICYEQEKQFKLNINKGWNLVSEGMVTNNHNYLDSSCRVENLKKGFLYFTPINKYLEFNFKVMKSWLYADFPPESVANLGIPDSELERIDNSYGDVFDGSKSIWVYSDKSCNFIYKVSENSEDIFINQLGEVFFNDRINDGGTVILLKGWNFLSVMPGLLGLGNLDSIKGECNMEKVYIFNSDTHSWEKIDQYYNFKESELFKGVIIKTTSECNLGLS